MLMIFGGIHIVQLTQYWEKEMDSFMKDIPAPEGLPQGDRTLAWYRAKFLKVENLYCGAYFTQREGKCLIWIFSSQEDP